MKNLLFVRTAMFAEGVGNTEAAGLRARKGLKDDVHSGPDLMPLCGWLLIAPAILESDYKRAIQDSFLIQSSSSSVSTTLRELGSQPNEFTNIGDPDSGRRRMDYSLLLGVVPLAFRLATLRLRRDISEDVEVTAVALEEVDEKHGEEWKQAAGVFRMIFAKESSEGMLTSEGRRYFTEQHTALGVLFFLGSLVRTSIAQSLTFQIRLAADLEKIFKINYSIRNKILLPFFIEFWADAIRSRSTEFRTAATYTERRYQEALLGPANAQIRKLLDAMVFCVGLSVPDDLRQ